MKRSLPFLTTFAIALALASAREVNRDVEDSANHTHRTMKIRTTDTRAI